jgi:hypothetical protein
MPDGNLGAPAVIHVRKDGRIGILGKFSSHKGKMENGRWHRVAVSVDLAKPEDSDDEDAADDDDTSAIGQCLDLQSTLSWLILRVCDEVCSRDRGLCGRSAGEIEVFVDGVLANELSEEHRAELEQNGPLCISQQFFLFADDSVRPC